MVSLSPRFAALAVLCSVASLTFPRLADAAAIGLRSTSSMHGDSIPVVPLPDSVKDAHEKRFAGAHGSMFAPGEMWMARHARRSTPASDAAVDGYHKAANLPRHDHHHHHHHGAHDSDKVVIKGSNDVVKVYSRSVLVSGDEGSSYVVDKRMMPQERFHVPEWKRAEVTGVPGTIDIMSPTENPDKPQRVASLVLAQSNSTDASNGTDSSNSTASATVFVLNASPDDQTQMYLVPMGNSSTSNSTQDIPVMLQIPVFEAASASSEAWCATFDPAPPQPMSMTAEKCLDASTNGVEGDHKSQVFSYNTQTGAVRPTWSNGQNDGASGSSQKTQSVDPETPDDASIASVTDYEAPVRRQDAQAPFSNSSSPTSSMPSSATSSTSSTSTAPSASATHSPDTSSGSIGNASAQDVMLMFVPSEPQVNSVPEDSPSSSVSDAPAETTIPASSTTSLIVTATPSAQAADVTQSSSASSVSSRAPTTTSSSTMTSSSLPAATNAAAQSSADDDAMGSDDTEDKSNGNAGFAAQASSSSALVSPTATDAMNSTATPTSTSMASTSTSMPSSAPTAAPAQALDVQVVPEAASSASSSSLSMSSAAPSASMNATSPSSTMTASTSSVATSASSPTMTPLSTEPYTWMFKRDV